MVAIVFYMTSEQGYRKNTLYANRIKFRAKLARSTRTTGGNTTRIFCHSRRIYCTLRTRYKLSRTYRCGFAIPEYGRRANYWRFTDFQTRSSDSISKKKDREMNRWKQSVVMKPLDEIVNLYQFQSAHDWENKYYIWVHGWETKNVLRGRF